MSDVTRLLQQIDCGNALAAEELLPLVYDQLRLLAGRKLRNEAPGQTLQGTALVHEAYLKLVDVDYQQHWANRRHFFAAAAEAMRRILVDNARRKKSVKHGGQFQRQELQDDPQQPASSDADDLLAIHEALEKLSVEDPQKAELVKLRYFAGLTLPEIAEMLGISRATASRHWTYAKAWIYDQVYGDTEMNDS